MAGMAEALASIPTGGNILMLDFFSFSRDSVESMNIQNALERVIF